MPAAPAAQPPATGNTQHPPRPEDDDNTCRMQVLFSASPHRRVSARNRPRARSIARKRRATLPEQTLDASRPHLPHNMQPARRARRPPWSSGTELRWRARAPTSHPDDTSACPTPLPFGHTRTWECLGRPFGGLSCDHTAAPLGGSRRAEKSTSPRRPRHPAALDPEVALAYACQEERILRPGQKAEPLTTRPAPDRPRPSRRAAWAPAAWAPAAWAPAACCRCCSPRCC